MGVKGLSSLLKDYSQIYQDIRFRDSKLLVDGTNLAYNLYDMANLDQNHGGEYLAYQVQIQALFKALIDCEIKAYVVIDGGSGTSDIKLDTRMDRQRARLENIPAALKGKKMGIFPPSIMSVFEQTLNDMKVPLVKCFGEADGQLAALAKEWSFPVLSGDTDFFIYALPKGFCPCITSSGTQLKELRPVATSPASYTPRPASAPSSTSTTSCCPSSPRWPGTTTSTSEMSQQGGPEAVHREDLQCPTGPPAWRAS